jgi:hypothetical protein
MFSAAVLCLLELAEVRRVSLSHSANSVEEGPSYEANRISSNEEILKLFTRFGHWFLSFVR